MKAIFLILFLGLSFLSFAINPDREYKWTPETRGLQYKEYQIRTIDNYSINVWEYQVPDSIKSNRTIILVGTDAGNMSYLIWQAKALVQKGFRVISFDYRGFGKSSNFVINKDFLFYAEFGFDLDSVIKSTREKYSNEVIGLYAMSMGTYVTLLAKEKFDFLIAEGFYQNPQRVVDRIKINKGKLTLLPITAMPIEKIRKGIPVMIFCASEDKTTTPEDAKEFGSHNTLTVIVEFPGEHLSGMNVFRKEEYGDEYVDKILGFLKSNKL